MVDPKTATGMFEGQIESLKQQDTLEAAPRVQAGRSITLAQQVHDAFDQVIEAEEAKAPEDRTFGPAHFEDLKAKHAGLVDDAMVRMGAEITLEHTQPVPDEVHTERTQLFGEVRDLDSELYGHLAVKGRKNPKRMKRLAEIRKGRGREDDARDVLALCLLVREDGLDGLPWTLEWIAAAEAKATRQLELLNARPMSDDEVRILRNRAWARFAAHYEMIRRAGEYVTGDASRFPRLSA
jgi:hypothetical protein